MIIGGHSLIYSRNAEADRVFLRDVIGLPHVDVGEGWLIFGLPPAELAVHPAESDGFHEFHLMCDDVDAFVASMQRAGIPCVAVEDRGYGRVTEVTLPSGGKLGVYQPRHERPAPMDAGTGQNRAEARPRRAEAKPRRARAKATRAKVATRGAARTAARKGARKGSRRPASAPARKKRGRRSS